MSPPEHLQLYSVAGLRAALGRVGLAVSALHTHAVNPHELLAAVPGKREPAADSSRRVETAYRLNEALSTSVSGALVKRVANAFLSATRLGDTIKVVAERVTTPPVAGRPRG